MSIKFQDGVDCGVNFKYSSDSLASLSTEDLRALVASLNVVSDQLGCVIFEGNSKSNSDLVVFAGNLERFAMLSVARQITSRVFYFQDTMSWWYGGSKLLPNIQGIGTFLRKHVGRRKCLVFGQSSGGYAALVTGGLIPHCDVLACSPQTFPDAALKRRLHVSGTLAVRHAPDHLIDIEDAYRSVRRSGIAAALFSASEFNNPYESHFWLDHLHLAKIARVASIDTFIASSDNHSVVFQRARMFSDCLKELVAVIGKKNQIKLAVIQKYIDQIGQTGELAG